MTFIVFETRSAIAALYFGVFGFFDNFIPVTMAEGPHPFPFRTRQLSPPAPMVLPGQLGGRVGRCRDFPHISIPGPGPIGPGLFC